MTAMFVVDPSVTEAVDFAIFAGVFPPRATYEGKRADDSLGGFHGAVLEALRPDASVWPADGEATTTWSVTRRRLPQPPTDVAGLVLALALASAGRPDADVDGVDLRCFPWFGEED